MIPHAGAMCLLDAVVHWNSAGIRCRSQTHRDADNPMRVDGQLPALCGVEYAAQAMAVHGALAGLVHGKPLAGYLAGLRDVVCSRPRLDNLEGDLVVDAERLLGDAGGVIYRFTLHVGETQVLSGRATVVLDAGGAIT